MSTINCYHKHDTVWYSHVAMTIQHRQCLKSKRSLVIGAFLKWGHPILSSISIGFPWNKSTSELGVPSLMETPYDWRFTSGYILICPPWPRNRHQHQTIICFCPSQHTAHTAHRAASALERGQLRSKNRKNIMELWIYYAEVKNWVKKPKFTKMIYIYIYYVL